jgi:Mrp family chromosome partitioning ATPase
MRRSHRVPPVGAAFARLRDEICLRSGPAPGVIVIASARRSEGRTSVAAGLAEAFGRALRGPALLVDCDLMQPALHTLFSVPVAPGVSDLLRESCSLPEALHHVGEGTIGLVPAGSRSEDASLLLTAARLGWLLDALRAQSEAVVVDAPPVEAGIPVRLLSAAADGTVLVVRADHTTEGDARAAYASLAASRGVNVLGAVLSGARRGRPAVGYGFHTGALTSLERASSESLPPAQESRSD